MRDKIIKILKDIEKNQTFKKEKADFLEVCGPNPDMQDFRDYCENNDRNNLLQYDYEKYFEEDETYNTVRVFLTFPNYKYIAEKINDENKKPIKFLEGYIKNELKRMEYDGLLTINEQPAQEYIVIENGDFSSHLGVSWKINTESITLTTKGISKWKYLIHKATENPIATITSVIAIIISIISLSK